MFHISEFPIKTSYKDIPLEYRKTRTIVPALYLFVCALLLIIIGPLAYFVDLAWFYVLCFVFSSILGDTLLKLQHEAMHGILVANKQSNIILGKFISALVGTRYYDSRVIHMQHHTGLGEENDPNLYWYDNQKNIFLFMISQLLGAKLWMFLGRTVIVLMMLAAPAYAKTLKTGTSLDSSPVAENKGRGIDDLIMLILVQSILLVLIAYISTFWIYMIYILLPPSTLGSLIESIRSFSEHVRNDDIPISNIAEKRRMFLVSSNMVEKIVMSQFGFQYHHLHHLYPTISVFNLEKLHIWMKENVENYCETFVERKSYTGTLIRYLLKKPLE